MNELYADLLKHDLAGHEEFFTELFEAFYQLNSPYGRCLMTILVEPNAELELIFSWVGLKDNNEATAICRKECAIAVKEVAKKLRQTNK